jgi:hypothetical protein
MVILEGANCKIVNYERDSMKKEILYDLWKMMDEDGDLNRVLWSFEKYDLTQFIQYMSDTHNLLFIIYNEDYSEYAGLIWVNEIMPNFKAHTAIYIRKKYRKVLTDEASKLSIDFMFKHFNLNELWSHTPYPNAHKLSLRLGSTEIAILPNYLLIKGVPHDYHISRLSRS